MKKILNLPTGEKKSRLQVKNQKGQIMLLTILVLSGTILVVTTIAGILMLYQIRQTINITDSAKAIFAADTGIEWGLYKKLNQGYAQFPCINEDYQQADNELNNCELSNKSSFSVKIEETAIISTGYAGRVARAFKLSF